MPTVLRERGFEFIIYTRDHGPAHVHIKRDGNEAVIDFETIIDLRDNWGFRRDEIRIVFGVVRAKRDFFLEKWRLIHG